ncbi:hypothetical protein [Rathayibacter sp. VKM Ac-2857]|uniref:hypothetical protein n=1 Tax=Rathayibacter sp. VKM Ac-2857 TaxID=2739020 RepID=UPI0015658B59|nr:hypothetical protein [Rathayibacter sp. VKM Ac-2857]NQX18038.1 hypothetical protein [Rathayibacter sp. VKM Ac-2857]
MTAAPPRSPAALTTGSIRARTAEEIRVAFEADGAFSTPIGELEVSIEDWRWIARSVARRLGRSVTTTRTPTHVSAGLETHRGASKSRARDGDPPGRIS